MKTPKLPDTTKIIGIAQLAAILIIILVIYKILTSLGIIKSKKRKEKIAAKESADSDLASMPYFDPLWLKKNFDGYVSLGSIGKSHVELLRAAMRLGASDQTKILSVFSRLHNKRNIAELTFYYNGAYKRDLLTDLLKKLSKAQVVKLIQIINQLPAR